MIFAAFFHSFFVDFMFNFASWPGRPDKRRTHTEHTQSTHRAHAEHTQSPREATKPERAEVVHEDVHDDSHEDSHEGSHEYR